MVATPAISLRVSLTESCQFRCIYCRPDHAAQVPLHRVVPAEEWIARIERVQRHTHIEKVRFTGGEPLLYPLLDDVLRGAVELGIADVSMTTNALQLAPRAQDLFDAGLRRVNISLDSLEAETFRRMNGAPIGRVLDGIDAALAAGLKVKLNTVVLRGHNDTEVADLARYATDKGVAIRYLELMPIGPTARDFDQLYVSGEEIKSRLAEVMEFSELPYALGETSRNFRGSWHDGSGEVTCGFILPTSTPFCEGCNRLRVTAEGKLVGCLAQPDRFELEEVEAALAVKSRPQSFEQQAAMVSIGG